MAVPWVLFTGAGIPPQSTLLVKHVCVGQRLKTLWELMDSGQDLRSVRSKI
jgi:hypothetical protein